MLLRREHSHTHTLLYRNCGFEFAIKKNLKQDRIMVALMRLNKISICFVELEEMAEERRKESAIIVTIVTHHSHTHTSYFVISAQFISHMGDRTIKSLLCCFWIIFSRIPQHFAFRNTKNGSKLNSHMNKGQMPWSLLLREGNAGTNNTVKNMCYFFSFCLKKGQSI